MLSTFFFGCLELKRRFSEIPFPKSIVLSDLVLDKLRHRYKSFSRSLDEDNSTVNVADGLSPGVLKISGRLNYLELCDEI